ncbi:MAG: hypothetical protein HFI02_03160 [Lachnospiraceae bacterium]|nr:hypothetical protein [Lachnospiraceae bacterium]
MAAIFLSVWVQLPDETKIEVWLPEIAIGYAMAAICFNRLSAAVRRDKIAGCKIRHKRRGEYIGSSRRKTRGAGDIVWITTWAAL